MPYTLPCLLPEALTDIPKLVEKQPLNSSRTPPPRWLKHREWDSTLELRCLEWTV